MFFGMPGYGFYSKGAIGDSSWLALPLLNMYPDAKKIHVVRDPLKTISSLIHSRIMDDDVIGRNMYGLYKAKNLPELMQWKGFDRYIFFWTVWNNVAMKECEKTFKLENISKNPAPLFKYLKVDTKGKKLFKKKYNAYNDVKQLKMSDLKDCDNDLLKNFKILAEKLGYKLI